MTTFNDTNHGMYNTMVIKRSKWRMIRSLDSCIWFAYSSISIDLACQLHLSINPIWAGGVLVIIILLVESNEIQWTSQSTKSEGLARAPL